eukprot:scaffold6093_cov58-Cylindrotheca_fusiformis.AAC.2
MKDSNEIGSHTFAECESLSHMSEFHKESTSLLLTHAFPWWLSGVGPISIFFPDEEDREDFFQSSKLASLVDDEDDLIHRLNHRFDNSLPEQALLLPVIPLLG